MLVAVHPAGQGVSRTSAGRAGAVGGVGAAGARDSPQGMLQKAPIASRGVKQPPDSAHTRGSRPTYLKSLSQGGCVPSPQSPAASPSLMRACRTLRGSGRARANGPDAAGIGPGARSSASRGTG